MTTGGDARWTGYLRGSERAQLSPGQPAGMARNPVAEVAGSERKASGPSAAPVEALDAQDVAQPG